MWKTTRRHGVIFGRATQASQVAHTLARTHVLGLRTRGGADVDSKPTRQERSLIAVHETVEVQRPVVLASGNQAVAFIVAQLMKLTPSQRSFLRRRFYERSDAACANKLGISPATVKTWKLRNPRFLATYRELLAQPLLHARAELLLLAPKAVATLGELLDSPNPQVRADAVDKVLKGRDAQLLTNNNAKPESGRAPDPYVVLLQRLANRRVPPRSVAPAEPPVDAGDGDFREVPAT
jgi:hypothetical protein